MYGCHFQFYAAQHRVHPTACPPPLRSGGAPLRGCYPLRTLPPSGTCGGYASRGTFGARDLRRVGFARMLRDRRRYAQAFPLQGGMLAGDTPAKTGGGYAHR